MKINEIFILLPPIWDLQNIATCLAPGSAETLQLIPALILHSGWDLYPG